MFQSADELDGNVHFKFKGCLNDMCLNITDHIFKSRTGDICKDCLNIARDKSISNKYLKEINRLNDSFAGFIKTREKMISSDEELTLALSPLNNNKVFTIPELGNIVVQLNGYDTNTDAAAGGIPFLGLYRTGGVVKIRLDIDSPIIILKK
jgi:hypothetical protein